jgi:hypothetical protein
MAENLILLSNQYLCLGRLAGRCGRSAHKKAQRRLALRHGRFNIVIRPIQYAGALQKLLLGKKSEFNVNRRHIHTSEYSGDPASVHLPFGISLPLQPQL